MKKQLDQVADHLERHCSITSQDAFHNYGITRLAHYIYKLRKSHWPIETEIVTGHWPDGRRYSYARYHLHGI